MMGLIFSEFGAGSAGFGPNTVMIIMNDGARAEGYVYEGKGEREGAMGPWGHMYDQQDQYVQYIQTVYEARFC